MNTSLIAAFFLISTALMGEVLGLGNLTHVVGNLDRSIQFYHDALGLEIHEAPRAFSANAALSNLFDAPGAQSRTARFKIPGSNLILEIVEFQGVKAAPVPSRFYDPGAVTLSLVVEELEPVKARLNQMKGLEWIRASHSEVTVRDPDGMFVSLRPLRYPSGNPAPGTKEVRLGVTVEDANRTAQFYWETLGFAGTSLRGLRVPGDGLPLQFDQFNYVDRKPVRAAVHDPGVGVLQLRVDALDAMLAALKAEGVSIVSLGGEPVSDGGKRSVIVRDLNNFFLQLSE